MKNRKRYGRKIKRTKTYFYKSRYKRPKTRAQKIAGTVTLIIIVAALAFLGYCLGKPLFEYLSREKEKAPEWTPASTSEAVPVPEKTTTSAVTVTTAASAATVPETEPEPEPEPLPEEFRAFSAPTNALSNKAALSAVVAKAKESGYTSVVLQLKDSEGFLYYKSGVAGVGSLIKGSMTASEIAEVFIENNMRPAAKLSVLADNEGAQVFTEMSFKIVGEFYSWLDRKSGEPIRWVNPESEKASEYINALVGELRDSGFTDIILSDVIYPDFQYYDAEYIDSRYFAADRYRYLYNVIPTGTAVEMKASDITRDSLGRTAEALEDPSSLFTNSIAAVISRSDYPADSGNPADSANLIENVLSEIAAKAGGVHIVPVIDSDFAGSDGEAVKEKLIKLGYTDFVMR